MPYFLSMLPAGFGHNPRRMLHRQWFAAAVLTMAVLVTQSTDTAPARAESADRPNLVVIMADDLGYGDIGCYGNKAIETPHLDRLAAGGMRFSDFHSSGTVCSPTRAGLLTGRYQQRAGVPGVIFADPKQNRHHGLQTSEVTFAELLKAAGYQTAVVGKWHLGYEKQFNPMHHGFDLFRGYVSGNIDYISHYDRMEIYDWWQGLETTKEPGYSTHLISRHAVEFIDAAHQRPFCLYVAHEAPHSPFQGPDDPPQRGPNKVTEKLGKERIARARRQMIEEMDRGVGDIAAALKRHDIVGNTLVLFFSDNGAERNGSNAPLRGFKGSVWEGGHRVPAIASWPGKIEPGSQCDAPAITLDVMPTMLELSGARLPEGHRLDGRSLVPLLKGNRAQSPRRLYWQYRTQSAMRDGSWKLVAGGSGQAEVGLYDLSNDLDESDNLAGKHPQRVAEMQAAYRAWLKDVQTGATPQPEP